MTGGGTASGSTGDTVVVVSGRSRPRHRGREEGRAIIIEIEGIRKM